MNKYIKQTIILVLVFIIIIWVQNNDDKNKNKTRTGYYDKIKLPLLATALVGLFLNFDVERLIIIKQDFFNSNLPIPNYNPNAAINKIQPNPFSPLNNQDIYMSQFESFD
jgi:hypothetical protein